MTVSDSFISNQCFLDVQLSCHFVVLLIIHFQDRYPHLSVPLHLTGSNSYEIFFSKIGGMCGMERAYDFNELLNCANTLNHLAVIEYQENGLKFGRGHNKMENVWADFHFVEGELVASLGDYSQLEGEGGVIDALKEGFSIAQGLLMILGMQPKNLPCGNMTAKQKVEANWFNKPWDPKGCDLQNFDAPQQPAAIVEEDGDGEALRDQLIADPIVSAGDGIQVEGDVVDDGLDATKILEREAQDAVGEMLDTLELNPNGTLDFKVNEVVSPLVEFEGMKLYKSTLVSQLNGNPFLSKDRLTRVKNSVYFNNASSYLSTAECITTCLLGLGMDCGVYFLQDVDTLLSLQRQRMDVHKSRRWW
jgi:hypothetical protein